MRVAIDVRKLHDFGIGTYIRNLLKHLARIDRSTEYILLCRPEDTRDLPELGSNFRPIAEPSKPYSLSEQVRIPLTLRRERADLFHAPHYVLPPLTMCRSVVTIHDCIHLMFPQYLPNRLAAPDAPGAPSKIDVIYNAIDERLGTEPDAAEIARVRERFQLHERFILYVGNIKPHKNLERLIEAFHRLRRHEFEHVKLLIIGDEISKYPALRRAVHRHHLHKHVRFLGFVPLETLAVLYRLASVFVFPSLYEGFGLPPLEAMASGTPVVTSNVSSLPEVVGDAAILVDPYDPEAIAEGIRRALTDPELRADLRARGLARVSHYSWARSVQRVWEIYQEVAS